MRRESRAGIERIGARPFTERLAARAEDELEMAAKLIAFLEAEGRPTDELASARESALERARAVLARIVAAALERAGMRPWPPAIEAAAPMPLRAAHAGQRAPRGSPETSRQVRCLDHAGAPHELRLVRFIVRREPIAA